MVLKPDTRQECLYGCSVSFTNSLNHFYHKGILLSLAPVAGNAVQEDEPGVDLDLLEFESHLLRVPRDRHPDLRGITVGIRQIVPEKPTVFVNNRMKELFLL